MMGLRRTACLLLAFAAPGVLLATNYISLKSGGQSFVLDTDSDAVQKNLKPANPQAGEVKLPAWLYPFAGAVPLRANYDVRSGISSATFAGGGTVEQSVAYYAQLLASKGFATGTPLGSPTSKIVSGKNAYGTVSVMVGVPFRNPQGGVEITTTYAPSETKSPKKHFETVWYDDARALLCLRNTATGEEYYLDGRGIAEANLNRPGAVASTAAAMPSWLPVYPNAHKANVKVIWLFEPTVTFLTRDSIRTVYEFYLAAVKNAGARVVESRITQSGKPLKDFDAQVVAQLGDDVVDIRTGEIVNLNPMPLSAPAPSGTGIGIRYTIPKRP
jgi:hypothetical protein